MEVDCPSRLPPPSGPPLPCPAVRWPEMTPLFTDAFLFSIRVRNRFPKFHHTAEVEAADRSRVGIGDAHVNINAPEKQRSRC